MGSIALQEKNFILSKRSPLLLYVHIFSDPSMKMGSMSWLPSPRSFYSIIKREWAFHGAEKELQEFMVYGQVIQHEL